MWTKKFWADAGERALRTFAQAEAAILIASGAGLLNADWVDSLSTSGMAALLSLLFSISGEAVRPTGEASFLTR